MAANWRSASNKGAQRIVAEKSLSDYELAQAVLARDRKASAEFVRLYTGPVHRYVWRRLSPQTTLAEDLVQEILLAAWLNLRTYTGESPLAHWILAVARFKVHDYYRAKLKAGREEDEGSVPEVEDPGGDLETAVSQSLLAQRAAAVLDRMREDYAMLLRWRYWDEYSAREMVADSARSEKSVERALARARREFRRLWIEEAGGQQ